MWHGLMRNTASSLIAVSLIPNYRSLLFNKRPWLDWVTKMSEWTQHHFSMPPDIYWVLYRTSLETRCQSCEISDIWYSPSAPIHIRAPWMLYWSKMRRFDFAVDVKFWLSKYRNFVTSIGLRRSPRLAENYARRYRHWPKVCAVHSDCMHVLNQPSAWMTLDDQR